MGGEKSSEFIHLPHESLGGYKPGTYTPPTTHTLLPIGPSQGPGPFYKPYGNSPQRECYTRVLPLSRHPNLSAAGTA